MRAEKDKEGYPMGSTIEAAFFDIDGTLVSFRTHDVPASAVEALRELHAAGVKLFIATGRGAFGIPEPVRRLNEEVPFDGFLTFNGQYCYTAGGEVIRDAPLDFEDVHRIAAMADEGRFEAQAMMRDGEMINRISERVSHAAEHVASFPSVGDLSTLGDTPVYQMCVYVDPGE